ncbi:hypothetical protein JW964_08755 [candidate division KSB1 bacterium]|nr:hypothetical protein [candidate division KSB1 bacterium]
MEQIGGILGQVIASFNILVLVAAYLSVYIQKYKQKRRNNFQNKQYKIRKLHETVFHKNVFR